MGFEVHRFPEHGITLRIISGSISADDVIRFYKTLDATHGSRWLTFIDVASGALDAIDAIPVARFPEIREVIAAKTRELFGDKVLTNAIVCPSPKRATLLRFWRAYRKKNQGARVADFSEFEAAYDWLELSDAARAAVTRALEARASRTRRPLAGASQESDETSGSPRYA